MKHVTFVALGDLWEKKCRTCAHRLCSSHPIVEQEGGHAEGVIGAVACLQQTLPMSLSGDESPCSPVPSTPAKPPPPHLFLSCLSLPKWDQLTATSWGASEASWPFPRASLASGLDRMNEDAVIHSHSTLQGYTWLWPTFTIREGGSSH